MEVMVANTLFLHATGTPGHRGGLPRDDPGTRFRVVVGVLTNIRHNFLSQVSGATGLSPFDHDDAL